LIVRVLKLFLKLCVAKRFKILATVFLKMGLLGYYALLTGEWSPTFPKKLLFSKRL